MKKRGQPNPFKAPPAKTPTASGAVPADADLSVLSLEVEREKAALLRKKAEKEETENLRAKQLEFSDAAAEVEADEKSARRKDPRFQKKNRERAHPVRALGFLLFSFAILALFFLPAIGANGKSVSAFDLLKLTAAAKENVAAFSLSLTPAQAALVEKSPYPRLVLQSPHPSPLSAYRGFFGSRPFSQINAFLVSYGFSPVDWKIPEDAQKHSPEG